MTRKLRLKVFQAQFGFRESIVATPSRKAALQAWGAHQDLFADGLARLADDPAALAAATASPGEPLSRPIGSGGAFERGASGVPDLPQARRRRGPSHRVRTAPDRSRLDAAAKALESARAQRKNTATDFNQRLRKLEASRDSALADLDARIEKARQEVDAARKAFQKDGGEA